ncbi:MAG TPA: AAA family ATPase [Actinomycetaceae bacterium]|nr:AAA family ATPase [Actinomycetaceae bacterium]
MNALPPSGGRIAADRDSVARSLDEARRGGAAVAAVDGRSGSGKTDLAAALAGMLEQVRVLHLEDAYRGWHGLAEGLAAVTSGVLAPLAEGRAGAFRSWDWYAGELGELRVVPALEPGELLLIEGCGALAEPCAAFAEFGVWCEATEDVRRSRAAARDPYEWSDKWAGWAFQEESLAYRRVPDLVLHTG